MIVAELPPEMARLIEAARRAHDPSDADCERVRRGLAAAIGTAGSLGQSGAPDGAAGSLSPGPLSSVLGSAGGKLLLAVALLGGAGGLYTWSANSAPRAARPAAPPAVVAAPLDGADAPPPGPVAAAALRGEGGAAREGSSTPTPAGERARAAEPLRVPSSLARPRARLHARASAERAARADAPPPAVARVREQAPPSEVWPPDQQALRARPSEAASEAATAQRASARVAMLREPSAQEVPREVVKDESEVTLIRAALASLNAGDPQRALELLEAHAARYPIGAMGRERAGLRVLALCATGRSQEGRREQAAFLAAASDSPLQNRVRGACEPAVDAPEPNQEQAR
jgi:hypothetical protein